MTLCYGMPFKGWRKVPVLAGFLLSSHLLLANILGEISERQLQMVFKMAVVFPGAFPPAVKLQNIRNLTEFLLISELKRYIRARRTPTPEMFSSTLDNLYY